MDASPGDFMGKVVDNKLFLPKNVMQALSFLSIRSAGEFLVHLHSFPTAIAAELGWPLEDVSKAKEKLIETLKGYVPDELLKPPTSHERGFGSLPPKSR